MLFFMAANWLLGRVLTAQAAFLAAYPPALLLHYLLNKRWTFADPEPTDGRKVADYLHAVVATFLIQWPVFTVGQFVAGWPPWLAAGAANLAQMVASFLLLQWRVFRPGASGPPRGARAAWARLAGLLAVVAVSVVLVWTVLGKWEFPRLGEPQSDYYNRLLRGFERGSLALDLPVPARLAELAVPWDPTQRPPDLLVPPDVSYAHGRFYLYFGAVPVVTLLAPFKLLTGQELPFPYALAAFVLGAFWILAGLWQRLLRNHVPEAGWPAHVVGTLVLGLCGGLWVLARRANFWELPIAAGQCFLAALLACAYAALRSERPGRWVAAAGLCLGLAVGCRPTLVVAGAGLAVLVLVLAYRRNGSDVRPGGFRRAVELAAWGGVPLMACLAVLFAYNHARFGSPFEFGLNYQLTSVYEAKAQHFSLTYIAFNLRAYFWQWPDWQPYFPFLLPPELPPSPPRYYSAEYVYGLLWTCPLLAFVLAAAHRAWRDRAWRATPVAQLVAVAAALGLATAGILLCFNTAVSRYTADFLPWWLLVALVAAVTGVPAPGAAARRRAWFGGFLAAAAFSVFTAFLASSSLHGMLQVRNPAAFAALSRAFNTPVAWAERVAGATTGPVEMDVYFSIRPGSGREPLLVVGDRVPSSALFLVEHLEGDAVRFSYESSRQDRIESPIVSLPRGRVHRIRLECGALYPPAEHPAMDGRSPREVSGLKEWVRVVVNGRVVIDRPALAPEISPYLVRAGEDRRSGRDHTFSGVVDGLRRAGWPPALGPSAGSGDLGFDVTLTSTVRARTGASGAEPASSPPHPLVLTGVRGASELLAIREGRDEFRLLYERWGAGAVESPPLPLPSGRRLDLRVRVPSLLDLPPDSPIAVLRSGVAVWESGRPVWWMRSIDPMPGTEARVARNDIGSTAAAAEFGGRVADWRRQPAPAWRAGPFPALVVTLGGRGVGTEPLVAVGTAGAANTLAIDWSRPGQARLLYDHWGFAAAQGPVFPWPEGTAHRVTVRMPGFAEPDPTPGPAPAPGRLEVRVDDVVVWDTEVPYYRWAGAQVVVGENRAGSSVAAPIITSVVLDVEQLGGPVRSGSPP